MERKEPKRLFRVDIKSLDNRAQTHIEVTARNVPEAFKLADAQFADLGFIAVSAKAIGFAN